MIGLLFLSVFLFERVQAPESCSGFPCCTKPVNNPAYDRKGMSYGYENGQSCVVPQEPEQVNAQVEAPPTPDSQPWPELTPGPIEEVNNENTPTPTVAAKVMTPTASPQWKETSSFTPTAANMVARTSQSASTSTSSSSSASGIQQANGYSAAFPSLPNASSSADNPCESANSILMKDLASCSIPLVNKVYDSASDADKASVDVVDCICTSNWRVGSEQVEFSIKLSCQSPGNLTKSEALDIHNGCSIFPYSYASVIDAVGIYVRLSNGDSYMPLSLTSGSVKESLFGFTTAFLMLFLMILYQ